MGSKAFHISVELPLTVTARREGSVSVTRRKHRAESRFFSQKAVTQRPARTQWVAGVQGGYGAVFAIQVQILLSITRVAIKVWLEPANYHDIVIFLTALAQCRGTSCLWAINLSRCRIFIAWRWACPGAGTITKLSWEQEQKQKLWRRTYPYCPCYS